MEKQKKDLEFGERITRLRNDLPYVKGKPVTIKEASKRSGINIGSFSLAENGVIPGEMTLNRFANFYGVSVDYLLGRELQKKKGIGFARRQEPPRGQDDYATKAARVLQLKSPAAEAIRRAIDELDREITPKMEIASLREKNQELQETIGDLEDRLAALEEKLERALGGNCEEKKHQATA